MQTWIALLRGINVGGNNRLPMAKLKAELESLKLNNVRTYIQSGNVVFECNGKAKPPLRKKILDCIDTHHGFRPQLFLLTVDELQAAVDSNPYPEATAEPKTLHFFFLDKPANEADMTALGKLQTADEHFTITEQVAYLFAPNGIGKSKLAANMEKHLGVTTTARNYRTVDKVLSMTK
ncbi:DUF1697 domain-containing protein [Rhodopirellula sp. MGV]|uniref:DUF1697 domain-containing protein n=1 Tax=Rhodopirellula sp. MGV TaxID=2023130 RepID=UPI000B95CE83|nr:DUF1697 domain-containing protein [Rhodopirellula sp. MGV]OYP37615.1 hypothetical protein CGZ80_04685 [Rhodopirellula sp. MGV]PNY34934.1 DUF1697 domain-containing protein [Rhodopirellula baltica]